MSLSSEFALLGQGLEFGLGLKLKLGLGGLGFVLSFLRSWGWGLWLIRAGLSEFITNSNPNLSIPYFLSKIINFEFKIFLNT